jgi:hypothetical protein
LRDLLETLKYLLEDFQTRWFLLSLHIIAVDLLACRLFLASPKAFSTAEFELGWSDFQL